MATIAETRVLPWVGQIEPNYFGGGENKAQIQEFLNLAVQNLKADPVVFFQQPKASSDALDILYQRAFLNKFMILSKQYWVGSGLAEALDENIAAQVLVLMR